MIIIESWQQQNMHSKIPVLRPVSSPQDQAESEKSKVATWSLVSCGHVCGADDSDDCFQFQLSVFHLAFRFPI